MDFSLTEEQRMIYEYGHNLSKTYDRKHWLEFAEKSEFPEDMYKQVATDGFVGVMVPEEYGGAGLGMMEMGLLNEGLSEAGIPLLSLVIGATMALSLIARFGTEEQKQKYLPDACAGKTRFCFAITEPNAGTNTIKTATNAVATPDGRFKLNGAKTFITDADDADYMIVVTRTISVDEAKRSTDGFTLFIVDCKAKGLETQPIPVSVKIPETQCSVFYDDVDVGPEDVLGEVDKGFKVLFEAINPERILVGFICAGLGRYAMGRAVEYANDRVVFDRPIGAYQALQHPLAKAKTEIEMAALISRKAAWMFDKGEPCGAESNMAKFAAAEAACHAVDASLQCFGGNGFTKEYGIFDIYPLARLLKTIPLNNEMVLNYIGEYVLGMPRSY
jgi:acyl-CoA dehydrogenase